jgi:hypothetical protein
MPQQIRIMQRYAMGESVRRISRAEKRDRETVAKSVRSDEMQDYVRMLREIFFGVGYDSILTVRKAVREGNSGMAYQLLQDIGVVPRIGIEQNLPSASAPPKVDNEKARDELLARLSEKDRMKFRLLAMAESRNDAYGLPPGSIEFIPGVERGRPKDDLAS